MNTLCYDDYVKIIKCCVCKKDKTETKFKIFHGRLNRTCNDCRDYHNNHYKINKNGYRDTRKEYYLTHKIEYRKKAYRNHLKRKYSLTVDEYQQILAKQNNKCCICNRDFNALPHWNKPSVDHNHLTKIVRGILCKQCNISIGYLEQSGLLQKVQDYLRLKEVRDKEPLR